MHGVLNTDNINVTGESFDYGPYRFLPHYDPKFTAAYFDHSGLYAYGRQPETLMWNLARLAECLMLVAERDELVEALNVFPQTFEPALGAAMCRRLNLIPQVAERDIALTSAIYQFMQATNCPFERVFFDWYGGVLSQPRAAQSPWQHTTPHQSLTTSSKTLQAMTSHRPSVWNTPTLQLRRLAHY